MNLDEALLRRRLMYGKQTSTRIKKGHDYAKHDNIHGNFDRMAKLMELLNVDITTSEGTAIFYIMLKIDRTCNLLFRQKDKPECEALEDTVAIDLPNYVNILDEIIFSHGKYGQIPIENLRLPEHQIDWIPNFDKFSENMLKKILDNLPEKGTSWKVGVSRDYLKATLQEYARTEDWVSVANIAFMLWDRELP